MLPPSIEREYERLKRSVSDHAVPGGAGVVRFIVRCPVGAQQLLESANDVLQIVDKAIISGGWPSTEVWKRNLPHWFVTACAPEMTKPEAERWIEWWQSLPADQQGDAEAAKEWSLVDWLYWMQPENRQWFWWDGKCVADADHLVITVEVLAWPFPWGSLRWLFRAAGASAIDPEM